MNKRSMAEWAALAEVIGAAAVVVSLLFVAFNIKQNTAAIEASTWESFLDRSERINLLLAESGELAQIVERGEADPDQLTPSENFRFRHVARLRFGAWEAVFNHYSIGRLDATNWQLWNDFYMDLLDHPGYRHVWSEIGHWYDPEFQAILQADYMREKSLGSE